MIPILDNSERARRTILFFWALLVAYALLVVSCLLILGTGAQFQNVGGDMQAALIAILFTGAYALVLVLHLALAVVYIQWYRRAYHNLQKAGHRTEMSEGWAAGSWFVPLANLVLPYRIMKEIWYKTQVEITQKPVNHTIVTAWWLAFIGGNVISQVFSKIIDDDDIAETAFLTIISSGIHIIAILLAVQVVKQVAEFEEGFKQRLRIETVGQQPEPVKEADQEEQY
ncbi:MAG: DUF4328 domain-containing protein [Cytophagales bacterium]|jgi:hypothetical protein|nr:DUF4328 domain-containing protein [Cytophagales bacterium]